MGFVVFIFLLDAIFHAAYLHVLNVTDAHNINE